ncbi:unnamed protein product [Ambrosiozyma monospora]|uniref:Unnamed protein product n=1 Tax=Ambrosiozyma monospora TaxID=43982 RepID=A0ACB5T8N2_AMBMO|nr:unnamed protein product [Ambrosiozyma monospora]
MAGLGNGAGGPGKIGGALPPGQAQPPLPNYNNNSGHSSRNGSGSGPAMMIPRKMPSLASLQLQQQQQQQPMYHNPGPLQHHVSQPQLQQPQLHSQHSGGSGNNKFVFTNNISAQQAQKQQKHARQLSNSLNSPIPSLQHLKVDLPHLSTGSSGMNGMNNMNGGMGMGGHGRNYSVVSSSGVSVHSMIMSNNNNMNNNIGNIRNLNNSNTIMEGTTTTTVKNVPFKRLDSNGPIPMDSFDDVHNIVPLPKPANELIHSSSAPASSGPTGQQQQQQQQQQKDNDEEEKLTRMFSEVKMYDTNDICLIDDHNDNNDADSSFDDEDEGSILASPTLKDPSSQMRGMSMDQIVGGMELGGDDLMDVDASTNAVGDVEEDDDVAEEDVPTQPLFFGSTPCLTGSGPGSPLTGSPMTGVAALASASVSSPALNMVSGSGVQTTIGTTADLPFFGANASTGSETGAGAGGANGGETIRCKVVRGEEMMMIKLPLTSTLHLLKLSILTNYVTGDPRQSLKLFDDLKLSCLLGVENGGGVVKLNSNEDLKFCLDVVCGCGSGKGKKTKLVVRVD